MKLNQKTLGLILIALAAIYGVNLLLKNTNGESTLKAEVIALDTAVITKIILHPKSSEEEVVFEKSNAQWTVSGSTVKGATPAARAISDLLSPFVALKPQRLAAKTESKWAKYEVTDTTATRVQFFQGSDLVGDILIGKISYKTSAMPNGGGPQGFNPNNFRATSYVRVATEDEVYAVEGFLSASLDKGFDGWRNKEVTSFIAGEVQEVVFNYPEGEAFSLVKQDSVWNMGATQVADAKVLNYLRPISKKSITTFSDKTLSGTLRAELVLKKTDGTETVVSAYEGEEEGFVMLASTHNDRTYFKASVEGDFKSFFKEQSFFTE